MATEKKTPKKRTIKRTEKQAEKGVEKKPVHVVHHPAAHASKYHFAVGRRKTAIVSVKLYTEGTGEIKINQRELTHYFPTLKLQNAVIEPLDTVGLLKKVNVVANAQGGGISGQADAMGLAIARALLLVDPAMKTVLKKHDLLTRDARKKERKKPGLKRARRAPQWQKR